MKRFLWSSVPALLLIAVILYSLPRGAKETRAGETVRVQRGTVVRDATALGTIEVEQVIPVKSLHGGILTRLFVKTGQRVQAGEPLAEVRPALTERELLGAERALEQARDGEESTREFLEGRHLASIFTRMMLGKRHLERMHRSSSLAREEAEEQLRLLREGEVVIEERKVDYIVRSPVEAHVLEVRQREGTPVVPASAYGSGTIFMTLADMSRLVFRGTVDEIDVGRLKESLPAKLKVGALPEAEVRGKLVEIGLQAERRNNAMVFHVVVELEATEGWLLRSGYSAVAEIEVDRRDDVLVVPERVVDFRGGKAFVDVPGPRGGRAEVEIVTGLSDGLIVEVISGLQEGQQVLERNPG